MDTSLRNLVIVFVVLALAGTIAGACVPLLAGGQSAPLQPPKNSAEWGGLQVWSTPGNAYVEIEPLGGGMKYGGWTDENGSGQFSVEPYRSYRVTVTKAGYNSYSTTAYVDATSWTVVTANL